MREGIRQKVFLFLDENICCGYSLEVPHWGTSYEYPQHMFLSRNKKNMASFWLKKAPYQELCFSMNAWVHLMHIIEVLFSTKNICFCGEIEKIYVMDEKKHPIWNHIKTIHNMFCEWSQYKRAAAWGICRQRWLMSASVQSNHCMPCQLWIMDTVSEVRAQLLKASLA